MRGRILLLLLALVAGIYCHKFCSQHHDDQELCEDQDECCYIYEGDNGLCVPASNENCLRFLFEGRSLQAAEEEAEESSSSEEEEENLSSSFTIFSVTAMLIALVMMY
jgi:hypothetical protein